MIAGPAAFFLKGNAVAETILEVSSVTKTFPGVKALDCVNFSLEKGTVHALVGENGAGKSTLMMVLGGVYKPDKGEIRLDDVPVSFESAEDANKNGISVVYQELSLVPNLSVAENIFAHRQPVGAFNMIRWEKLYAQTAELLDRFELTEIDPKVPVSQLTMAKRQVVEILKAMSVDPKILIFDEPTSSLTEVEIKELFSNIKKLKAAGISIIYISHHLSEIFEIADNVTVLRDGKYICNAKVKEIDEDFLVSNMVGRKIGNIYGERKAEHAVGSRLFEVKDLSKEKQFYNINFHINRGEIVGFSGLVGAGRTELGRAIFGQDTPDTGTLVLEGGELSIRNPQQAIHAGIGYMTEDRKEDGLYLEFGIKDNLIANHLTDFTSASGFLNRKKIENFAKETVERYKVVTPGIEQLVNNLSGGNQQKVLISSWLGTGPKLLIADEPTRGVDVGAKNDIYNVLRSLAAGGIGIMLISSDLPEIIGMSDRVYVMRQGRIAGEVLKKDATEERIISLAAGITYCEERK
jgi:ABC-type sugar transport system ATPase subunit